MRIKIWLLSLTSIVIVGVCVVAVYSVRQYVPALGLLILACIAIALIVGVVGVVTWVGKYFFSMEIIPVEESGAYARWFGRIVPLAPLGIAAPAPTKARGAKTEVALAAPTLFDLIEDGTIAPGNMEMVMGYDKMQLGKGILELIVGPWPGTHAIAGKGRSGKTRRVLANIAQALIGGAQVIVCDPHFTKADSLARSLEPLARYLTIAQGEEAIVAASQQFLSEMESRVEDASRPCTPILIVFDEWSRLMDENNAKMPEGGRDLLVDVAKNCSIQYAGYYGFCCIIGQIWTQEACGGTDIRRSLQSVFVHQLSAEYAAFFFRAAKWKNKAEEIKRRDCIYRNSDNEIAEIVTVGVPDDTATRVAAYLASLALPEPYQNARLDMPDLPLKQPSTQASTWQETRLVEAPGRSREARQEAVGSNGSTSDEISEETLRRVMRYVGKRAQKGDTAAIIKKELGITGGRASQEIDAAFRLIEEGIEL